MDKPTRKRLKELAAALKAEPGSIPKRLELAAALREAGQAAEAVELYRGVAEVYAEDGRLVQAIAVCRGILDIDPEHRDTLEMLATLVQRRTVRERSSGELHQVDDGRWVVEPSGAAADDAGAESDEQTHVAAAALGDEEPSGITEPEAQRTPLSTMTRFGAVLGGGGEGTRTIPSAELPSIPAVGRTARPSRAPGGSFVGEDSTADMLAEALAAPLERPLPTHEPPPFPLLSDLPRAAFLELLTRLTVVRLGPHETVLREGDPGDACYLISEGRVRVRKGDVELALLGPGSFFGEFAVLSDQRRHASVETVEPVELLEIRRELIDELVANHPGVARTLSTFYRDRLIETLLATAPFFARLAPEERKTIAERFRPRRFGRGAQIIEEGAPGGGLYLLLVGEVEVVRQSTEDKTPEIRLGTLGEGSYFGEMSLLRGGVASATVRALRITEAVQLPPRDFYEIASQHPVLWEQLRTEAERRELANHAIVAGEARKSDDGTIYLV